MKHLIADCKIALARAVTLRTNVYGAFILGVVVAINVALESRNDLPLAAIYSQLVFLPLMFTIAGAALWWSDFIRKNIQSEAQVSLASRVFFASGLWSVAAWFSSVLILGFPLAILLGTLSH